MTPEEYIQYTDLLKPILEAVEENTAKVQELLERVECIDNNLDDIKAEDCQAEILSRIDRISTQLE